MLEKRLPPLSWDDVPRRSMSAPLCDRKFASCTISFMRGRNVFCLLLVVALALCWRLCGLTFDSLWLDEGYQSIVDAYGYPLPNFYLQVPAQPFLYKPARPAAPRIMLANFRTLDPLTPPLYQLLLNRWIGWFGDSDSRLRLLSVVISTAGAGATFLFGTLFFGWAAGLLAGLLQALSPFDVYYGQEVRMYALQELAALLSGGTLILLLFGDTAAFSVERGRRKAAGDQPKAAFSSPGARRLILVVIYAVATWALINTHYTGLFLFAYEILLALFVCFVRRSWPTLALIMAGWAGTVLMWLPWFGMFRQAAALRTASFYVARKPTFWWPFYALFYRIPANWVMFLTGKQIVGFAAPLFVSAILCVVSCLLLVMPPSAVPTALRSHLRRLPEQRTARLRFQRACALLLWAIVPATILWLLDVIENHRVLEIARYLMATAPAIFLLAGAGLARLQWRSKILWVVVGTQLFFSAINNVAHATVYHQREPWREMASLVQAEVTQDQLLLVSQYYDIVCLDRYLTQPYRQVGVSSNTTTAELQSLLNTSDRFALVTAQEGDRVVGAVPQDYYIIRQWDVGHSLHLLLYARR